MPGPVRPVGENTVGAGDRLPAGRPVAEGLAQFGEPRWVHVVRFEGAYGVPDPDHAVGGAGGDARQQPGPPGAEHVTPRVFAQLPVEVRQPVTGPLRIAERRPPVVDRVQPSGQLVESAEVVVEPTVHLLRVPVSGQRLDGHRSVVGEPALVFGAGAVQSFVRLVENAVAHAIDRRT